MKKNRTIHFQNEMLNQNYGLIFAMILTSLMFYCCYNPDDEDIKTQKEQSLQLFYKEDPHFADKPEYIKSNLTNALEIAYQLNSVLGEGDTYQFNDSINLTNSLIFDSVHDFIIFKSDHFLHVDYNVTNDRKGYHLTRFKDVYNCTTSVNIRIQQKLDDEDQNQYYVIKNLVSELKGVINGRHWWQHSYHYSIFNGTAIIDLYGYKTYNIFINSCGIVFTDAKHYKIIIDIHTAYPLSIHEIDE